MATWQLKPGQEDKKDKYKEAVLMVEKPDTDSVSNLDNVIAQQQSYLDITVEKIEVLVAKRAKIIKDCEFSIE